MPDAEFPRSIRLPKRVWEALDRDAERCRRSSTKQLEALLMAYYELEDVELSPERLSNLRPKAQLIGELAPRSKAKSGSTEKSGEKSAEKSGEKQEGKSGEKNAPKRKRA